MLKVRPKPHADRKIIVPPVSAAPQLPRQQMSRAIARADKVIE
jgi:hypothetical protein